MGYEPDAVAFNRDGESAEEDETNYKAYLFEPVHWLGTVMPYLGHSVSKDIPEEAVVKEPDVNVQMAVLRGTIDRLILINQKKSNVASPNRCTRLPLRSS